MWVKVGEWFGTLSNALFIGAQISAFFWIRSHYDLGLLNTGGLVAGWLFLGLMWWRFMQIHEAVLTQDARMRAYIDHKFQLLEKDLSWNTSRLGEIERHVEAIRDNTADSERVYSG